GWTTSRACWTASLVSRSCSPFAGPSPDAVREEFCQAPLCLKIDLDTYENDWRHVARFRGRSGWLIAARATLQSETDIFRTIVAAACDEWENRIPSFQAAHLLECVW